MCSVSHDVCPLSSIHRLSISFAQHQASTTKSATASLISSLKQSSHQTMGSEMETDGATHRDGVTDRDSLPGSIKTGGIADGPLPLPDLPKQTTLTKEEDEMGIATPELLLMHAGELINIGQFRMLLFIICG